MSNTQPKRAWRAPGTVLAALGMCLAGCGGGGGGGSPAAVPPAPPPEPPAPPPPAAVSLRFADVTAASGIHYRHGYQRPTGTDPEAFGGGVAAGDYDDDGRVDLFVVRGDIGPNLLYRNLGGNVFTEVAASAGVAYTKSASENHRHSGPTFADIDGDGDLDLFFGGLEFDPSFLFRNNGDGTFADVTSGSGLDAIGARYTVSAAFGDYDLDGDLDLFLTHWGTRRRVGAQVNTEHLWRNDTAGPRAPIRFTDVSLAAGIAPDIIDPEPVNSGDSPGVDYTFTPTFARLDQDRHPDLVVAADFRTSMAFMNNGDGTFRNVTDRRVIVDRNGMGSALGDYDGDGDLDWFVTSILSVADDDGGRVFTLGNRLYGNAFGEFFDVTEGAGVADGGWGWGACFADFDLDGDLDIYHTNGWPEPFEPSHFDTDTSRLFLSEGDGRFFDRAEAVGVADAEMGYGVVCADFDNDGDVDLFQTHRGEDNSATLWRNDAQDKNFLRVRLRGAAPNTQAAGARMRAVVGEQTQMREVMIGSNFTSQNPALQVFGLGAATRVERIEVEWPDGTTTTRRDVAAGQTVVFEYPRF